MAEAMEARYWDAGEGHVDCRLCPWHCRIAPGKSGRCLVRRNEGGVLRAMTYGRVTSVSMDPIEKKPLYHFRPGSEILSVGSWGCNLSCLWCQNWTIAQQEVPTKEMGPAQAVALAKEYAGQGNIGLAYTYNEPFIWFEYVYDTAKLAHEHGLVNVLVTNGIVEEEPLEELLPYIDALNVDIKSMRDEFYQRLTKGQAWPARRTVEKAYGRAHVEITNLVVTGENDSDDDFRELAAWASSVSPKMPVHISRYFPACNFSAPATPAETLVRAMEIISEKCEFVYVGNASLGAGSDTVCPKCGAVAVKRSGYRAEAKGLVEGRCRQCGEDLYFA
jgi:pyruvate formate lyase activating enzyme